MTATGGGGGAQLAALAADCEIVQLAHEFGPGLAQRPENPGFRYHLNNPHDDAAPRLARQLEGSTSASDRITLEIHTGTHIDSLGHIAMDGRLADGSPVFADDGQSEGGGVRTRTVETMRPLAGRAVLLDFPDLLETDVIPDDYVITAAELQRCCAHHGVTFGQGDIVLIRTGRDALVGDSERFYAAPFPGVDTSAARALAHAGVVAAGADTFAFEASELDVVLQPHVELLQIAGIFILECLDLRALAVRGCHEFFLTIAPLRIAGATGSPVNPLAFVPPTGRAGRPAGAAS